MLHVLLGLLELLTTVWEMLPRRPQPADETAGTEAWLDGAALLAAGAGFPGAALLAPEPPCER